MVVRSSNSGTFEPPTHLNKQAVQLLKASLSKSSKRMYYRSWQLYFQFHPSVSVLPLSVVNICNFIAHLYEKSYSPSTIYSHVSAISFLHKLLDLTDPTSSFIAKKLLKGCENLRVRKDSRLPITKDILSQIVNNLEKCVQNFLHRVMLKAVFLLAFHAFLRLGEILTRSPHDRSKVLQVQDIKISIKDGKPYDLTLTLRSFKNIKHNLPVTLSLEPNHMQPSLCPVQALITYRQYYRHNSGPLFQFVNGTAVSHNFVVRNLSSVLNFLGLNANLYKGHSFRIGAATHAASLGWSESQIRRLGRWNSNAMERYIRISSFKLQA